MHSGYLIDVEISSEYGKYRLCNCLGLVTDDQDIEEIKSREDLELAIDESYPLVFQKVSLSGLMRNPCLTIKTNYQYMVVIETTTQVYVSKYDGPMEIFKIETKVKKLVQDNDRILYIKIRMDELTADIKGMEHVFTFGYDDAEIAQKSKAYKYVIRNIK
jgi:hypothetical protein